MLKIRRPLGRLIFNMGIAIPGKTVFLIETAPRAPSQYKDGLSSYGISFIKIRRPWDRLIVIMWIPILVKHLYIETAPDVLQILFLSMSALQHKSLDRYSLKFVFDFIKYANFISDRWLINANPTGEREAWWIAERGDPRFMDKLLFNVCRVMWQEMCGM